MLFATLLKLVAVLMVLDLLRTYARAAWTVSGEWGLPPLPRFGFVVVDVAGALVAVWYLGARA